MRPFTARINERGELAVIRAGTALVSVKGSSYIPEHELALSVTYRKGSFPVLDLAYDQASGYLARQDLAYPPGEKGWSIAEYQGSRLGFLKNVGSRYNNYYPAEWRIRMNRDQAAENKLFSG
ncbi:MAG: hypothetical protein R2727_11970 [Bacteroidales bacterium]